MGKFQDCSHIVCTKTQYKDGVLLKCKRCNTILRFTDNEGKVSMFPFGGSMTTIAPAPATPKTMGKPQRKSNTLQSFRMVKDEDTAYDEVIKDINAMSHAFVTDKKAQALLTKKLKQLMRLLNDDDSELE